MMQLIFRNRWAALIWALCTMGSIATFVSKGGGSDRIEEASAKIKAQRAEMMAPRPGHTFYAESDGKPDDGFTPDEDVDPALAEAAAAPAQPASAAVVIED